MALQDNKSTSASIVSTASVTSQQSTVKADVITSSSSGSTSSQFQRLKVNSCMWKKVPGQHCTKMKYSFFILTMHLECIYIELAFMMLAVISAR